MMYTSLDHLMIAFMLIAAVSLLSLTLMFLVRRTKIRKICFWAVSVLAVYISTIAIRIGGIYFPFQTGLGIFTMIAAITSPVLSIVFKNNEKVCKITRVASAVSLVLSFIAAFMI